MEKKLEEIIEKVSELKISEMAQLVKAMEEKFGISAAVAVAGGAVAGAEDVAEEKSAYDVILVAAGGQKIQVIKVIREALGIGLKEAKDITDAAPKPVKNGLSKADADELKAKLEVAGATVELK